VGQITTLFVHKVVGVAARGSADRDKRRQLLQSVGVDPDAPVNPKLMIPDTDYYALCERVARESDLGVALALEVGGSMRSDDYGAFGLAWKSAVDLRGSYLRAVRYWRVLTSVSAYEIRQEAGRSYMMLHREGARRLGMRLSNEQSVVAVTQISREVSTEPFVPVAVYFKHPSPANTEAHEAFFGCPVHFGADRDALEISEEALSTRNRLGDATISKFFDAHLEKELAELADEDGLDKRVRIQVSQSLSEGVPSLVEVATRLGMSARTLQRRLSDQGWSFQVLVDEARRQLAERLLRDTDYALNEIAFLSGFSEQSAFNRAFKRWQGTTPRSYRLAV
jgi:AraC-like DNA-binding protein